MKGKVPSKVTQPIILRLLHWSLAFFTTVLVITGLYRAHPGWAEIKISSIRLIHSSAGFLLLITFLLYIGYHLLSKSWTSVFFLPKDIKKIPAFIKYVLFLKNQYFPGEKYNPGQKAIYTSWIFLWLLQLITGLMLYAHRFPWGWSIDRIMYLHYLATFGFVTIIVHIYLSLTEDPSKLQAMFTGKEK